MDTRSSMGQLKLETFFFCPLNKTSTSTKNVAQTGLWSENLSSFRTYKSSCIPLPRHKILSHLQNFSLLRLTWEMKIFIYGNVTFSKITFLVIKFSGMYNSINQTSPKLFKPKHTKLEFFFCFWTFLCLRHSKYLSWRDIYK